MVQKYKFGTPFETEAVVREMECAEGLPSVGTIETGEHGFCFTYTMGEKEVVYGLGETLRGMNKRGYRYISYATDDPHHHEDKISLYGSQNFILLDGEEKVGLFFDYPTKLEFDIGYTRQDTLTVSCAKADLYLYVLIGESALAIVKEFRQIIGKSYLPPKWGMGFGQSRWGYKTPEDFLFVADTYRKLGIPLDAVYMDIDYMERYKDFTTNEKNFPDFPAFTAAMKEKKVHLVPIIDAGVKVEEGYSVHDEGVKNGYFCTGEDGKPYMTAVWPGPAYMPDFLNAEARAWFGSQYQRLLEQGVDGFWNDMNEPSIFYTYDSMEAYKKGIREFLDSPIDETAYNRANALSELLTTPENYTRFYHNVNGQRVCHDQVHNLFGYNMTRAAGEAFERISPDKRILMFSRSSYIGMHRYGGIWTGDNKSWWSHLLLNIKMMPALNMCGFLFTGADIGGFGVNTTRDLVLRWLAFGVFTPLMRNHAALGTREQECYQWEKPEDFAHVVGVRYRLLPYLYSELVKAVENDEMYFRPLAFEYPEDAIARETEDQLMLGDSLMVAPVYQQNASGRVVYLPEDMLLVKFMPDGTLYQEELTKGIHYISVALNEVPMFVKKNHIVPLAQPAQCVAELNEEDFTVVGWTTEPVSYELYQDDGYTRQVGMNCTWRTISK